MSLVFWSVTWHGYLSGVISLFLYFRFGCSHAVPWFFHCVAEDHIHLSPYLSYVSGAVAGCAATVGSYPFDLIRTILASQGEPKVLSEINVEIVNRNWGWVS